MKKTKMKINNLSAAAGDSKGEINLQWDSVANAVSYVVEIADPKLSNEIKWKIIDIISDPRYTVKDLKSNKNYLFRVALMTDDSQGKLNKNLSKKIIKKAP
ncbi:MAG: fibronectin type III domain-containing protein [Ignavibacteria bacterium]|nr:fibronectin type III domain-containing protein [Ignavibacteria bacterium]